MKKLLAMVLSLTMVIFSLVGCSKPAEEEKRLKSQNRKYRICRWTDLKTLKLV